MFQPWRPHIDMCNGSHEQNKKYVMKEGTFYQIGDEPISRQAAAAKTVKKTIEDIMAECIDYADVVIKYPGWANSHKNVIKDYYALQLALRPYTKPRVIWVYGPTGTGKSALAYYICGEHRFRKVGPLDWFDGYKGQENVTFDDFRKGNCKWDFLLNLLDHYKVDDLPVKGSFVPWRPKLIVFTSPNSPEEEFAWKDGDGVRHQYEQIQQILRRIDVVIKVPEPWTYLVEKGEADIDGESVRNWIMNEVHE